MYTKKTVVSNPTGLHARPASLFVAKAKEYESKVSISNLTKQKGPVDAKSVILLLTLAISQGTEIEITANGEDEVQAVDTLIQMIEEGFGEL